MEILLSNTPLLLIGRIIYYHRKIKSHRWEGNSFQQSGDSFFCKSFIPESKHEVCATWGQLEFAPGLFGRKGVYNPGWKNTRRPSVLSLQKGMPFQMGVVFILPSWLLMSKPLLVTSLCARRVLQEQGGEQLQLVAADPLGLVPVFALSF